MTKVGSLGTGHALPGAHAVQLTLVLKLTSPRLHLIGKDYTEE